MEACKILSVSENQLEWFMKAVSELLRGPKDKYFQKLGDLDRERLKVFKFKAKIGWVLLCVYWPKSGGHSNLRVCSRENKQGWRSFLNMLEKFSSKEENAKWFSRNHSKNTFSSLASNTGYAEKVKTKDSNVSVTKKGKEEVVDAVVQTDTKCRDGPSGSSPVLKPEKQSMGG